MEITYGHRVASDDDPYMGIGEELTKITLGAGNPGTTPVDIFPIRASIHFEKQTF